MSKSSSDSRSGSASSAGSSSAAAAAPPTQVRPRPTRRHFSAEYKLGVLKEVDACRAPGEIGAILRREGLYSGHLSQWRAQRREGALAALASRRRGPKPPPPEAKEVAQLRRENAHLRRELEKANLCLEIQKKQRTAKKLGRLAESLFECCEQPATPLHAARPSHDSPPPHGVELASRRRRVHVRR